MSEWTNTKKWVANNCDEKDVNLYNLQSYIFQDQRHNRTYQNTASPLHLAASGSNIEIPRLLLENNVNVNSTTADGATPLHWACLKGFMEMVYLLITYGADITMTDNDGNTALHYAAQGNPSVVQYLLQQTKLNINGPNVLNQTPMMIACDMEEPDVITILAKNGASIESALFQAIQRNEPSIVRLLLKFGKLKKACNDNVGMNPLHYAVILNRTRITQTLLHYNKWLALSPGRDGKFPIDCITESTNCKIQSLLSTEFIYC